MSLESLLEPDKRWMKLAIREAEKAFEADEVPVGAVIVRNGMVLGKGHNMVESLQDPTAHAEIIAITAACSNIASKVLDECTIYVTLEPCPMCAGSIILSKIPRLVFGALDPKTGACSSVFNLTGDERLNHQVETLSGIMEDESQGLLRDFFRKKRDGNVNPLIMGSS